MKTNTVRFLKSNILPLLIVFFFAFFAGFSLLHPGLPPTHDGEYHVIRFFEFNKTLRDGSWYPRWASDLDFGLGMPLFTYVYPFPNYIASVFHAFGISFIEGFKLNIFAAIIIGSIFFYLWTKIFWGRLGGIVSAIFYTFSPYHFVDIYIRGSVGEVWALAWYPAFLWAITKLVFTNKKIYIPVSGLFLGLIIFSHNILALAFFPFAICYSLMLLFHTEKKLYAVANIILSFLIGIGLSMIFWLPALLETKYVTGLQVFNLERNFPDFYQLLIPSWGSDIFGTGSGTEMSVQVGVVNIFVIFISIFALIGLLRKHRKYTFITLFFLLSFFIIFLLMLHISLPIWQHLPLMNYFQFPWRFLSLEILICSFLAGGIVRFYKPIIVSSILIFFVIITTFGYAKPAYYMYRQDSYYTTRSNFIDGTNSPGNAFATVWMNGEKKRVKQKATIIQGNGKISSEKTSSTNYVFELVINNNARALININFFPGWKAYIDKSEVIIRPTEKGLMAIDVTKGKHILLLSLKNTPIQLIGMIGSFISFLFMLTLLMKSWYIYTIKKNEYST